MHRHTSHDIRVILDYDGTLTREELQAGMLRKRSLHYLATEVLGIRENRLERDYQEAQSHLLAHPERYGWMVNGQVAAFCDEGAFILNTVTMQELLSSVAGYRSEIESRFSGADYEPVMACVNHLFHEFTHDLSPFFRSDCEATLSHLLDVDSMEPVVLTNSKGDKVERNLVALGLPVQSDSVLEAPASAIRILGDVRQYDMCSDWPPASGTAIASSVQVDAVRIVDLRRPAYYRALVRERGDVKHLVVVADGYSLAGSLPLEMGIPFLLVKAPYTPDWVIQYVNRHPLGRVLEELGEVLDYIDDLTK